VPQADNQCCEVGLQEVISALDIDPGRITGIGKLNYAKLARAPALVSQLPFAGYQPDGLNFRGKSVQDR
jgi:hypothetical protein